MLWLTWIGMTMIKEHIQYLQQMKMDLKPMKIIVKYREKCIHIEWIATISM